ncbi:MAG: iron chaperone, partial [Candidatus Limnocylindria bacterium]
MATQTKKRPAAKTTQPKTVEAYIAAAPKEHRAALMKLRKTIKAAAPRAAENVSYGMAGYKQDGQHVMIFGYWKEHFALYGGFDKFAAELKSYDQSGRGTVRFPADKPLPYGLVTKMVKA